MIRTWLLVLLGAALAPVFHAPAAAQDSTTAALQAEIEHLKIVVEVKQQRIELLERELESYRKVEKKKRRLETIAEIQREVERLRRLRAKQPVEVAPLDEEVIGELLDKEIADRYTEEQFRGWELSLKQLGLVPPKMKVQEFLRGLYAEQAAGLYDDKTKKLYVSDKFDLDTTIAKVILAHEICHALQDQHFNLTSSPIHLKSNDDAALAALSMIEGDATLLMTEYLNENVSLKILFELPQFLMMDQQQLASAPPFFTASLLFPYMQGMQFVMEHFMRRGQRARNRLLENFPRSTEQVIHSEKYSGYAKDEPTEIDLDALISSEGLIPAENRFDNVAGEFGIQAFLKQNLSGREAGSAAAGWDGDRMLYAGQPDGEYVLVWLSIWDDPDEAEEFAEALVAYFRKQRPDLEAQIGKIPGATWFTDERGSVAVAREGDRVACVHCHDLEHAAKLVSATLSIRLERVP